MKKKKARGKRFPVPVTRGSVTVLINRIRKKPRYTYYQVRFYTDGVRKAKSFSDLGKAERAAAAIARKLHKGEMLNLAPGTISERRSATLSALPASGARCGSPGRPV